MANLTLRTVKGIPLTTQEIDNNFISLNNATVSNYSITDLGAVGDNSTDNTTAFNSIEASATTFFYVPAGTYRTTHLQLTKTYWGPGTIRFNDGYVQKGLDFTEQTPRNLAGNRTVSAPGDLILNPNGNVTFAGKRIQNIGSPMGALDGVNLNYINTEIAPRIDEIETTLSDVETAISDVETAISDIETTLNGVETAISDIETTLSGVETTLSGVETALSGVAAAIIPYSTGTFTPVLSGGTVSGTGTYTLQQGSWVKIGKLLTVRARVIFTNHTGTGGMNMSFGAFNAPAGAGQIGQVLTTFPYGVDSVPNYSNSIFSGITTAGTIAFYKKQSDGLYTTLLNLVSAHSGTATAGGTNTITLASNANANTNYYCDRTIKITSGTGAGQERKIIFYNGTTKLATTTSAWATVPDATSVYTVTCSGSVDTVISIEV